MTAYKPTYYPRKSLDVITVLWLVLRSSRALLQHNHLMRSLMNDAVEPSPIARA